MTRAALLVVLVVACGSVTPKASSDAGTGGGLEATGGAGGELGGRGGQTGAGGELDAGIATTGPCAGLCSNPISINESGHQHMQVKNTPPGSCYAITTTPAYELAFSCAGSMSDVCGYSSVSINGRPAPGCAGALYVSNFSMPGATVGQDCVQFNDCATSAAVGFY